MILLRNKIPLYAIRTECAPYWESIDRPRLDLHRLCCDQGVYGVAAILILLSLYVISAGVWVGRVALMAKLGESHRFRRTA